MYNPNPQNVEDAVENLSFLTTDLPAYFAAQGFTPPPDWQAAIANDVNAVSEQIGGVLQPAADGSPTIVQAKSGALFSASKDAAGQWAAKNVVIVQAGTIPLPAPAPTPPPASGQGPTPTPAPTT